MKNQSFSLLLVLSGFALQAQSDWQLFRPGVQYLFEHTDAGYAESPLLGIKLGTDSCTTMYPSVRWRGEFECNEIASSFMGYEVCQTNAGTRLRVGDDAYVFIRQTAPVGETWPAYTSNGDTVWAQVSSIESMTFLGLTDSVKFIYFFRQNGSGAPEYLPAENRPVQVSKQYGLISTFIFRDFPYEMPVTPGHVLPLAGLSEPKTGLQNPGWAAIFNFQAGDELHLLKISESILFDNQGGSLGQILEKEFFKATITEVETNDLPQEIAFHYEGQRIKTKQVGSPTSTFEVFPLENISGVWNYSLAGLEYLNLQPGELYPLSGFGGNNAIAIVSLANSGFCDKTGKYLNVPLVENENCYQSILDTGPGHFYLEDLAGSYYTEIGFSGQYTRNLVYFHNDQGECGVPLDFDHILAANEPQQVPNITLGPNPTSGPLLLQLPQGLVADLKLYDGYGRTLFSENQARGTVAWNLGALPVGAYQVSAWQEGRLVWRQGVLKQ